MAVPCISRALPLPRRAQPTGLRFRQPSIGVLGVPTRRALWCCQLVSSRRPAPLAGPRHASLFPKHFAPSSGDPWSREPTVSGLLTTAQALVRAHGHGRAVILLFILSRCFAEQWQGSAEPHQH